MKIYIISPLSAPTQDEIVANAKLAAQHKDYVKEVFKALYPNEEIRCFAPHSYLPLELDDTIPEERKLATDFNYKLLNMCDSVAVFTNGTGELSKGMIKELHFAINRSKNIYTFSTKDKTAIIKIAKGFHHDLIGECVN